MQEGQQTSGGNGGNMGSAPTNSGGSVPNNSGGGAKAEGKAGGTNATDNGGKQSASKGKATPIKDGAGNFTIPPKGGGSSTPKTGSPPKSNNPSTAKTTPTPVTPDVLNTIPPPPLPTGNQSPDLRSATTGGAVPNAPAPSPEGRYNGGEIKAYEPTFWDHFYEGAQRSGEGQLVYGMVNDFYISYNWIVHRRPYDLRGVPVGYNRATSSSFSTIMGFAAGPLASEINALRTVRYSVAFETNLPKDLYPGGTYREHFSAANEALDAAIKSDAGFAASMEELGITIPKSSTGRILGESPKDWVWHHHVEPGVMQLVPKGQHTPGSVFWKIFHPNNKGGMYWWN